MIQRIIVHMKDGSKHELPPASVAQMVSAMGVIISAPKVSEEIAKERTATCEQCDKMAKDQWGNRFCSVCRCSLSGKIVNLALYEERLPQHGCKHPDRASGHGWKR